MKVLLDSHAFLWALDSSRFLGKRVRVALDDESVEVWLSAATVWVLGIKASLGRLTLPVPLRDLVASAVATTAMRVLPVTPEHALKAAELPPPTATRSTACSSRRPSPRA